MWIIKVLAFLWPFLKEMVLGKKTLGEAIQTNKTKVFVLGAIITSFALNFFMLPRLVVISKDYIVMKKDYEQLMLDKAHLTQELAAHGKPAPKPVSRPPDVKVLVEEKPPMPPPPQIVVPPKTVVVVKRVRPVKTLSPENSDRYSKMRDDFDRIKQREAGNN